MAPTPAPTGPRAGVHREEHRAHASEHRAGRDRLAQRRGGDGPDDGTGAEQEEGQAREDAARHGEGHHHGADGEHRHGHGPSWMARPNRMAPTTRGASSAHHHARAIAAHRGADGLRRQAEDANGKRQHVRSLQHEPRDVPGDSRQQDRPQQGMVPDELRPSRISINAWRAGAGARGGSERRQRSATAAIESIVASTNAEAAPVHATSAPRRGLASCRAARESRPALARACNSRDQRRHQWPSGDRESDRAQRADESEHGQRRR